VSRLLTRATAMVVVAATACLATGCGIPMANAPTALPRAQLPSQLIRTPSAGPATTLVGHQVTIFLVEQATATLSPANRNVSVKGDQLLNVIQALLDGPVGQEGDNGLTTALTDVAVLSVTSVTTKSATVTTVNFNAAFEELPGIEQEILAVAQVVFTAADDLASPTLPAGAVGVTFEVNGEHVDVPISSGAFTSSPVTINDYASQAPTTPAAGH
jgi:hypothetical protein